MKRLIGKVILNGVGQKVISFDDATWAALPVGASIYTGAQEVTGIMIDAACTVVIGVSGDYGEHNDRLDREAAREVLQAALEVIDERT